MFIPESRKKPLTSSLLYKQIVRFFEEEKIADKFEIKFIEIPKSNLPPTHFRSGALWVKKEQIEQMAGSIVEYVLTVKGQRSNVKIVAYVRGSYLEAVRLASKKSGIEIKEIFTDEELTQLKKKGIMWMKVGLRMPTAFIIFRMKMRFLVMDNKKSQLKLF